jgi:hypothetical protein
MINLEYIFIIINNFCIHVKDYSAITDTKAKTAILLVWDRE